MKKPPSMMGIKKPKPTPPTLPSISGLSGYWHGIAVHKGLEKLMPKVKYDRKKVLHFLNEIIDRAASSEEDKLNVALDLFIVALNAQENEFKVQAIVDFLGQEFKMVAPKVAKLEEIPF